MADVREEAMSKPSGELITQMTKQEFRELLTESLCEDFDLDSLCTSGKKKDRVKGRQVFCIMTCVAEHGQELLPHLLQDDYRWIHFRSAGEGMLQIEVELRLVR